MQKSEKIHLEVGLDYLCASIGNKESISLEKKNKKQTCNTKKNHFNWRFL